MLWLIIPYHAFLLMAVDSKLSVTILNEDGCLLENLSWTRLPWIGSLENAVLRACECSKMSAINPHDS